MQILLGRRVLLGGLMALIASTTVLVIGGASATAQSSDSSVTSVAESSEANVAPERPNHGALTPDWQTALPPAIEIDSGVYGDDGVADDMVVSLTGGDAEITVNGDVVFVGPAPHISVTGSGDDDTLTVVVNGEAVSTIHYDGGDHQTETGDILDLTGDTGDVAYYPHSKGKPRSGTVVASNGGLQIEFEAIEPFAANPDLSVAEPYLTFFVDLTFAPDVANVVIEDDPTDLAGPGSSRLIPDAGYEWGSFAGYTTVVLWSGEGPELIRYRGLDPATSVTSVYILGSETVALSDTMVDGGSDQGNDTIIVEAGATVVDLMIISGWYGSDTIDIHPSYTGRTYLYGSIDPIAGTEVDVYDQLAAVRGDGINRITGGSGDDSIIGADNIDYLRGNGGDDFIDGFLSIDRIWGGPGTDVIYGGGGSDRIKAGPGNDEVYAGSGADRVWGGSGNDIIYGMGGQDTIWGEGGDDELQGNDQSDDIWGGPGNDFVGGSTGKDELFGEAGDDTLAGGPNSDILKGGAGRDIHKGGPGRDTCEGDIADSFQSC